MISIFVKFYARVDARFFVVRILQKKILCCAIKNIYTRDFFTTGKKDG